MPKHYILLPSGIKCSVKAYVAGWKKILAMNENMRQIVEIDGWDNFSTRAWRVLELLRAGLHDRINKHVPGYGIGRKWDNDWQVEMSRASRMLNTPRLRIYWLPQDLKERFKDRLCRKDD